MGIKFDSMLAAVASPSEETSTQQTASLLSLAELSAAKLDGDLFQLGLSYAAWGYDDSPRSRALSLVPHLPDGLIVDAQTALWVYGCIRTLPHVLTLCVPLTQRRRPRLNFSYRIREIRISPDEVCSFWGLSILTPVRLARDLLLQEAGGNQAGDDKAYREDCRRSRVEFRMLCLGYDLTQENIADALAASKHPYRRHALRLLTEKYG